MTTYSIRIAIRVVDWYIGILNNSPERDNVKDGISAFTIVRNVMQASVPKGKGSVVNTGI